MDDSRFMRTRLLTGDDGAAKLAASHVLVLGLGGVGAYVAEMLGRAGVGRLTLIDGDTVAPSNCNRQLPALSSTIGQLKAEVVARRLRDISPELELDVQPRFLRDAAEIAALLDGKFDYAVDAIDEVGPKVEFILTCRQREIPLISSMGAGGKWDPLQVKVADIGRTCGCALARTVRGRLRDAGVSRGVRCVYSPEPTAPGAVQLSSGGGRPTVGTISYLPAVFGCVAASVVLRDLLGKL